MHFQALLVVRASALAGLVTAGFIAASASEYRPADLEAAVDARQAQTFFALTDDQQQAVRKSVAPPPLAQRRNPYSTPMYYPMWGETSFDGTLHADWQEALIRDWAEVGMTQLHFYAYPDGVGTETRTYDVTEATREGIAMFRRLCRKYGIKIGMRVDLPYSLDNSGKLPIGDYWIAHPRNPDNELKPYWEWLAGIVSQFKGNLEYVILGDEIDWKEKDREKAWSAEIYMEVFRQAADTIHKADPETKVSMYGASSGRWNEVIGLLQSGYTDYGDAIAINHYDYTVISGFKEDLKKYSPDKKLALLSNGVGYIASDTPHRNPPEDPYSRYNDRDQAAMIARTMYTWWDIDADVAPYYICLRGYTYKGEYHPWWYGFFGFMDLVIDENDQPSIKRYPGWYAFRTIAAVFHDRPSFTEPSFRVEAPGGAGYLKAHERAGQELLIIAWGNGKTDLRIGTTEYGFPVRVDLMDHNQWTDVPAVSDESGVTLQDIELELAPTIIRLVPLAAHAK